MCGFEACGCVVCGLWAMPPGEGECGTVGWQIEGGGRAQGGGVQRMGAGARLGCVHVGAGETRRVPRGC